MCAQFTVAFSWAELVALLGGAPRTQVPVPLGRVLPFKSAPVLLLESGEIVLKEMQFSLTPAWSETKRTRFATHNARVETIAEKPTWRKPAETKRALIPLSSFIEPVYRGDLAGSMVDFYAPEAPLLLASALYDQWINRETGESLYSCAIITGAPSAFVEASGHDRQPIFLASSAVNRWFSSDLKSASAVVKFLGEVRSDPQFEVRIDRPLKPGWEKKQDA